MLTDLEIHKYSIDGNNVLRNHCSYCLQQMDENNITRDHVTPRDRGGSDNWFNITYACKQCNTAKDNRTLLSFLNLLPEVPKSKIDKAQKLSRKQQIIISIRESACESNVKKLTKATGLKVMYNLIEDEYLFLHKGRLIGRAKPYTKAESWANIFNLGKKYAFLAKEQEHEYANS